MESYFKKAGFALSNQSNNGGDGSKPLLDKGEAGVYSTNSVEIF